MATFESLDSAGRITGRIVLGAEAFAQSRVGMYGTAWGVSRSLRSVSEQSEALAHMVANAASVRVAA